LKVGILGTTEPDTCMKILNNNLSAYLHDLRSIGKTLADKRHEIVICPDIGDSKMATSKILTESYREEGGKKVIGIIPEDPRWGTIRLDLHLCDEIVHCYSWGDVPLKLVEVSDYLVVLSLSPGTMMELCWGKWIRRKFYVLMKYTSDIPREVSFYVDLDIVNDIHELTQRLISLSSY